MVNRQQASRHHTNKTSTSHLVCSNGRGTGSPTFDVVVEELQLRLCMILLLLLFVLQQEERGIAVVLPMLLPLLRNMAELAAPVTSATFLEYGRNTPRPSRIAMGYDVGAVCVCVCRVSCVQSVQSRTAIRELYGVFYTGAIRASLFVGRCGANSKATQEGGSSQSTTA